MRMGGFGEWVVVREMFYNCFCGDVLEKFQLFKEEIMVECFVLGLGFLRQWVLVQF